MLAQAPIERLLSGDDGIVFTVVIEGDPGDAQDRIAEQAWVSNVSASNDGHQTTLAVTVTDKEAAKDQLLRLVLADARLTVTNFGRRAYELEEIFMNIVEGAASD